MLKRTGTGIVIVAALVLTAFALGAFAPYYNLFIAGTVDLVAGELVDVTVESENLIITRILPESSTGNQVVTTNGYLLQLSYLLLVAVVVGARLLDVRWRRALAIATLVVIPMSHLLGVWLDTLEVKDTDQWVRTSKTVTLAWSLIPVIPMMASLMLQRVYLEGRNRGGGRRVRKLVTGQ